MNTYREYLIELLSERPFPRPETESTRNKEKAAQITGKSEDSEIATLYLAFMAFQMKTRLEALNLKEQIE